MLQLFGDLMHLIPAKLQFLHEKIFPQPVLANDLYRRLPPLVVQFKTLVPLIKQQLLLL